MKAYAKLDRDLDIKRFISKFHFIQNAMKFLTTSKQRKLIRMKADKNVLTITQKDKDALHNAK